MKDILSKSTSKYIIFGLVIFFAISTGVFMGIKLSDNKNKSEDKIVIDISQTNINQDKNNIKDNKININSCSIDELMTLDGVGQVKAKKIVENRPYKSIGDLLKVITESMYQNIKEKVEI